MRRPTWLQIGLCLFLVALAVCAPFAYWTASAADMPPALLIDPSLVQVQTVEAKINQIRVSLGNPPRTPDDRLRAAAAACFTRADFCLDANAYLSLLAAHGYPMGAVSIALGFGVSEDAVLSYWLADMVYRHRVYGNSGSSIHNDQGCAVQGIGAGVNLVCFFASEFIPFEPLPLPSATPTPAPLVMPRVGTPHRPFPTATPRWWRP